MSSPGNQGFVDLKLVTINNKPISDSNARVRIIALKQNLERQELANRAVAFPLGQPMQLPAFPQVNRMFIEVKTTRYKETQTDIFMLTHGQRLEIPLKLFRKPDQWRPEFVRFDDLPGEFTPMKTVLARSPELKVRGGSKLGLFIGPNYDNVTDPKTTLAKLGLLNLFTKMSNMIEPVNNSANWFSFVDQILEIAQSRVIALVRPEMGEIVRSIRKDFDRFDDYKNTPSGNHHVNMPGQFGVAKSRMFSVKSKDDKGNVQLTFGPGKDSEGNDIMVLDADIDESGRLLEHIADVFRHKLTKQQTHPFDIHEYLTAELPNVPLGYDLIEA